MRRPTLTAAQRDLIAAGFAAGAAWIAGALAVVWCAAALVVGSVALARWLGGL